MLGHASVRTTALYWQNIYRGDDDGNDTTDILTGKIWLERKEPPPTTENFPQTPKTPNPVFIEQKPLIPNKKSIQQYNSLSTPKTLKKTPGMLTNEILPSPQEAFLLNSPNKKSDQLKTIQPLPLIANQDQNPIKKEAILLAKIHQLEKQLNQTTTERDNLKQLVHQEKQRADNYQQQLKVIVKVFKQWQKINYCKQLEQQAQIIQSPKPPPTFRK